MTLYDVQIACWIIAFVCFSYIGIETWGDNERYNIYKHRVEMWNENRRRIANYKKIYSNL